MDSAGERGVETKSDQPEEGIGRIVVHAPQVGYRIVVLAARFRAVNKPRVPLADTIRIPRDRTRPGSK